MTSRDLFFVKIKTGGLVPPGEWDLGSDQVNIAHAIFLGFVYYQTRACL